MSGVFIMMAAERLDLVRGKCSADRCHSCGGILLVARLGCQRGRSFHMKVPPGTILSTKVTALFPSPSVGVAAIDHGHPVLNARNFGQSGRRSDGRRMQPKIRLAAMEDKCHVAALDA
jgi:hypothetical protein